MEVATEVVVDREVAEEGPGGLDGWMIFEDPNVAVVSDGKNVSQNISSMVSR